MILATYKYRKIFSSSCVCDCLLLNKLQCSWAWNSSIVCQGTWGSPILCHCLCFEWNIWIYTMFNSNCETKLACSYWL